MTRIKICGLRTAEHALVALDAGADMLGFIFAPSRRQISPAAAAEIAASVRAAAQAAGRSIELVGVFVNQAPDTMLQIAEQCDLDALQLSGDEPSAIRKLLPKQTLIKAIRLDDSPIERDWLQQPHTPQLRLLVDAHVPGSYGGAGVLADWDRATTMAAQQHILLAGGLTPANVGAAILSVHPWAVDVSSGVETDGVKDAAKIRAFIAATRLAAHLGAPTSPTSC